MTTGNLYIIGNKFVVNTFRILGCKGLVYEESKESSILDFIEGNSERMGGILLSEELYMEDSKLIKKIDHFDIPWIVLPSGDIENGKGYKELEKLAEKAIGMKLKI